MVSGTLIATKASLKYSLRGKFFLVRIFLYSNTGKYGPEKLLIRTFFMQWLLNTLLQNYFNLHKTQKNKTRKLNLIRKNIHPKSLFPAIQVLKCINDIASRNLKNAFEDENILLTTRQAPNLKRLLVNSKFNANVIPAFSESINLFPCRDCVFITKMAI